MPYKTLTNNHWNQATFALIPLLALMLAGCESEKKTDTNSSGTTQTANATTSTTSATPQSEIDWVKAKAKETGGDLNKLSAADGARVRRFVRGSPQAFKAMAQ